MKKILLVLFYLPMIGFGQNPNYSEDIAPILYGKCLQCHHNGGIAPLTLETYASVVSNAGMIQHVTSTGEMPPWPPDTLFQNYAYQNVLSMNEINTILDWITNGVPLGDTSLLPTMPTFGNLLQLGVPDLELQMPTYASTATSNSDDYICFSIPTGLLQNRRIKAIEVIPGNLQTVHHVLVSIDPFPNTSIVTTANCMGPQGDMIYAYAPGALPLIYPGTTNNSFGVELPANSSVSFAMHYPEGSLGQLDSTKVRFYFYPQSTVIREISNEFLINEGLFGAPFYLPPNQITEVTGSFGPTTQDYSFISVFPHMHLLGKDIVFYAVTPLNDTINLIRINNWDFEWQGNYYFEKFLKIPAGSIIYAKGNYDNTISSTNPNPVSVQSGFNTEDEMFIGIFQFLPYQLGDENISIENGSIFTNIHENTTISSSRKLLKITTILGQSTKPKPNTPIFYIYDDGTVEKKIIFE
ncbi:MAG: hypothetical protein HOI39_02560 [Flavobacteriales bacterium]|jgi:hypothetical protein|nr:hypothetical protein [Flavobacteriales bacterium]